MRLIILLILLLNISSFQAQRYANLLDLDGTYYLFEEPLSAMVYCDPHLVDEIEDFYFAKYVLNDEGFLVLQEIFRESKMGKKYEGNCAHFQVGDTIPFTGELKVIRMNEPLAHLERRLKHSAYFENCWNCYEESLTFEKGRYQNRCCVGEDHKKCDYQFGYVKLNYNWLENDYDYVVIKQSEDTIMMIQVEGHYDTIIKLPVGLYQFTFDYGDYDVEFFYVNVRDNHIYEVENYSLYYMKDDRITSRSLKVDKTHFLSSFSTYNSAWNNGQRNECNNYFELSGAGGTNTDLTGYMGRSSLISIMGLSMAYSSLKKDSLVLNGEQVNRQNYFGVYFMPEFFYRQYLTKQQSYNNQRLFFDLGFNYNLPLYFRKISRLPKTKIMEKYLHKYNEINLFARFGITNGAALQFIYKPFNVIKFDQPQLPKFEVGITFVIDQ